MTTREVQAALGNVSQQHVSRLHREGVLVAEKDPAGRLQFDRATVELEVDARATRKARKAEERLLVQAERAEKADRFKRQREAERRAQATRTAELDDLRRRSVHALERIANALTHRDPDA